MNIQRIMRVLAAATIACTTAIALAQGTMGSSSDGITVYGSGEITARANVAEIDLRLMSRAELTNDAIVKYRDTRKQALNAFEGLKMPNLKVVEQSIALGAGNAENVRAVVMNGMPAANVKQQVEVSSTLMLRVDGVRTMSDDDLMKLIGKLIDMAQDVGMTFGPSQSEVTMAYRYGREPQAGGVRFVLTDLSELREQVYTKAVADARQRAERLAKLSDLTLGPVISVQEVQISGDDTPSAPRQSWESQPSNESHEQRVSSQSFSGIPFRVKLLVRFGISPAAKTAQQTN